MLNFSGWPRTLSVAWTGLELEILLLQLPEDLGFQACANRSMLIVALRATCEQNSNENRGQMLKSCEHLGRHARGCWDHFRPSRYCKGQLMGDSEAGTPW